jgi:hypothetical protein
MELEGSAMSGRLAVLCAGLPLLAAVGCVQPAFWPLATATGPRQVVAAPHDKVAATLEAGLGEAGVTVLVKRLDGEVRLAGQTRSGKVFCLYVKRAKTAHGDETAVTAHWDCEPDEKLWGTVVDLLATCAAQEKDKPATP